MNINRIKAIEDKIRNNKNKLKEEKGNLKNLEILKLKILFINCL